MLPVLHGTLAAKHDVHTTVRHPNRNSQAIRTVEYGVGNAECGCGGVSVVHQGVKAVSCRPWGVGALPPVPMAALAAEDDVVTTQRHPEPQFEPSKIGFRSAVCRCAGVWVAYPSSQTAAHIPQGV